MLPSSASNSLSERTVGGLPAVLCCPTIRGCGPCRDAVSQDLAEVPSQEGKICATVIEYSLRATHNLVSKTSLLEQVRVLEDALRSATSFHGFPNHSMLLECLQGANQREKGVLHVHIVLSDTPGRRGIPCDLDMAKNVADVRGKQMCRTVAGTRKYMSCNLLRGSRERNPHSHIDDLESFLWIYAEIVFVLDGPGDATDTSISRVDLGAHDHFHRWRYRDDSVICVKKSLILRLLIQEIPSVATYWNVAGIFFHLFNRWRNICFENHIDRIPCALPLPPDPFITDDERISEATLPPAATYNLSLESGGNTEKSTQIIEETRDTKTKHAHDYDVILSLIGRGMTILANYNQQHPGALDELTKDAHMRMNQREGRLVKLKPTDNDDETVQSGRDDSDDIWEPIEYDSDYEATTSEESEDSEE